jgi:hypothetical protein
MNPSTSKPPDPLLLLPPSVVVQARLGELAREERILRQLLRLAVRAEQELRERACQKGGSLSA